MGFPGCSGHGLVILMIGFHSLTITPEYFQYICIFRLRLLFRNSTVIYHNIYDCFLSFCTYVVSFVVILAIRNVLETGSYFQILSKAFNIEYYAGFLYIKY